MRLLLLPSLPPPPPHINICGWLILAPELSAEKGGLVLTAAIAVVKRAGRWGGEQATAAQTLLDQLPDTNQRVRAGESAVREGETDKRR